VRIRLGGAVQAAKLINRVIPVYPLLAKQARVAGTVKLIGIVGRDGRVQQLQVISGHPLLIQAALDAVRQWLYHPTLLNGDPVEVVAPIDVHFTLSR
jgi:protein TonB